MFESPAAGIFAEREVKQFPTHHRFAQDIERGSRFGISVWPKTDDRLRVGHDWVLHLFVGFHVAHNVARLTTIGRKIAVPLLLSQKLAERVQTFIHPSPLAFVRVDDHREEVVPYFVDDDAQHTVFNPFGIGAIFFWTAIVETNHRVLHPVGRLYRDGHRIRIRNGVLGINPQGMRHGLGR